MSLHNETIGARVRRLRKERGWTQVVLAEKCRLAANTIKGIEANDHGMSFYSAIEVARALDCELEYLAYGEKQ